MDKKTLDFHASMDLALGTVRELWEQFLARSPLIAAGLLLLLATWLTARVVSAALARLTEKRKFKRGFVDLTRQLSYVFVWVAGLTLAAVVTFPDMTPAKALAGLGIGSLLIGFAFKDIVENFIAGILILWRFPFDPGDYIRWGEIEGRVEEVTVRMTLIRKTDGELVVMPNAILFKEPVYVLTHMPTRRTTVICGVAYGEDVDKARSVIQAAVNRCDTVKKDRPVQVFAREFADSSINYEVAWWTGARPIDIRVSRDQVVAAIKRGLNEAGIEIPFPYRTLTFKEPLRTVAQPTETAAPKAGAAGDAPPTGEE